MSSMVARSAGAGGAPVHLLPGPSRPQPGPPGPQERGKLGAPCRPSGPPDQDAIARLRARHDIHQLTPLAAGRAR